LLRHGFIDKVYFCPVVDMHPSYYHSNHIYLHYLLAFVTGKCPCKTIIQS